MSCLPTSPCYTGGSIVPSGTNCGADPCDQKLKVSGLITYVGPNLSCTGINTCDDLTTVIQKLEEAICSLTTTTTSTSTSSTSTTTTTSTSSTTTTTTTICPCSTYEFIGSDSELVVFEYVPCGSMLALFISPSLTPEYQCVNLAYPVTRVLGIAGSATDLNECCPTTTTTTTALPRFSFSSIFLGETSCGPVTTATMRWATSSPPTIGTFIYQNFAMTTPVVDGWYMNSTGDMSYQVTGGLGEVTNTQSCP